MENNGYWVENLLKNVSSNKQDFYDSLEDWLDSVGAKIEELEEKARNANEDIRKKMKEQAEHIKVQKDALLEKLNQLRNSPEETWQHIKSNIDEGINQLKDSVQNAFRNFNQK